MLRGKRTPVHLAMELQKEIVNKAFELVQDRGRVQAFPAFRYTHLQVCVDVHFKHHDNPQLKIVEWHVPR